MLALILHLALMPMPIGSRPIARWTRLAGMTIRPRATSARTSSAVERLAPGDVLHLGGDDAEPRLFDLSHDASNLREPVVSVEVHRLARPRTRPGRSSRSILDRRDGFGQFNRMNRRRGARGAVTRATRPSSEPGSCSSSVAKLH